MGTYDGGNDSGVSVGNYGVSRKIFINGKEATVSENVSSTAGTNPLNLTTTTTPFRIGAQLSGGAGFDGKIANVRIFSKKLLVDQIRELYEYDAERFRHRTNVVALHKGNLGVGVTHPTARLEVAGREDLQEYPPRAMTGYETYLEGHGVFRATESSVRSGNGAGYTLFAKDDGTSFWHSDNTIGDHRYSQDAAGTYTGTSSLAGISGEWVKLECPYAIKLESIRLHIRSLTYQKQSPEDWTLLGSNDNGSTWVILKQVSGDIIASNGSSFDIKASQYYKAFALVVTRIANNVASSYTNALVFGEWRLFGTPAPSSLEDGHLTLGKALTVPRFSGHAAGAETPRAESLVVHYDTTVDSVASGSSVVDTSGQGNNGTLNGDAAYSSSDRSFSFDGTGDFVKGTIPSSLSGNDPYSFSMWVKPNTIQSGFVAPFEMGNRTNDQSCGLYLNGGVIVHLAFANNLQATTSVTANQWMHIVGTYTSGSRKVYADGVLLASDSYSSMNIGATEMTLGANNDDSQAFNGFHLQLQTLRRRPHRRGGRRRVRARTHREGSQHHRYGGVSGWGPCRGRSWMCGGRRGLMATSASGRVHQLIS